MGYVFVKEGFSWPALIIPELWLIFRRMWLVIIVYLAVALMVMAIDQQLGGRVPGVFLTLAHLLFALEGNELRRWTLARHGYRLIGVAEGRRVGDAEIRFFYELESLRPQPAPASEPTAPTPPTPPAPSTPATSRPFPETPAGPPSAEAGEVVGLFPAPGGGP
jgi:hypothetical protein